MLELDPGSPWYAILGTIEQMLPCHVPSIGTVSASGLLPAKYQHEIDRPSEAFADSRVFIAHQDTAPVGMLVLTPAGQAASEVKRAGLQCMELRLPGEPLVGEPLP
jgi:hypothetical protein